MSPTVTEHYLLRQSASHGETVSTENHCWEERLYEEPSVLGPPVSACAGQTTVSPGDKPVLTGSINSKAICIENHCSGITGAKTHWRGQL